MIMMTNMMLHPRTSGRDGTVFAVHRGQDAVQCCTLLCPWAFIEFGLWTVVR